MSVLFSGEVLGQKFEITEEISAKGIEEIVSSLATKLHTSYGGESITFIACLDGSMTFATDLLRMYHKKHGVLSKLTSVKVKSYSGTDSGSLEILTSVREKQIKAQNIVLIEDIVDTGKTINATIDYLRKMGPKKLSVVSMFHKPDKLKYPLPADVEFFFGRVVEGFIVGYGLDYEGYFRDLPYLGIMKLE